MMTGPLSPRAHGFLDYGASVIVALAPTLFDFGGLPATLCYLFAGALFVLSLLTAYPLGVAKVIPFTAHGMVEAVSAVFLVIAPFLLGFSRDVSARNFFVAAGIALGIVFLVTNYRAAERPRRGSMARQRTYA
jgi:phosphatidylserine synthase